ncbi:LEAF RUST 10 DISEASE-RESISTANCE LOCUS RECEPTOR-LIKE PROTEIN KINASE-like 1.1 [Zea mays]|uniref:LEAF RUST 10 DISEASE-RESISTANCE LOCUS RECEPTOR-LIKE PROTEIN KINASE-like 1.1 n=1 Tax=Zea mays TaxID=4577 RepID=A0A1D6NF25_MAIZE|nr:LEAF RUST 10 DISEASE-RESISTANCE LOCUS RECEPTOR-LIKE PROTEIN KINASE-like 1.1 [Zea mays]
MAALCSPRRRLPLPLLLPLLLAVLVAASRGDDPSGDEYFNRSICKLQPYRCGEVNITYPFYLSDDTADVLGNSSSYCGYPGLAIDCVDDEYPTIQLGGGSSTGYSYNVTDIDYPTSTIYLADPDVLDDASCPRVDHNVTVSPSPTLWLNLSDYTVRYLLFFTNCSVHVLHVPNQSDISPIACASGSDGDDYSFVVPSEMPHQLLSQQCGQVTLVPVLQNATLTPVDPLWSTSGYRDALKQGFQLQWDSDMKTERCDDCERSSGKCAYNTSGEFVACLCADGHVTDHGCTNGPKSKTAVIAGVAAGAGVAILAAAIFLFVRRKRKQKRVVNSSSKLLKYSGSGGTPRSRVGDMESGSIEDPPTHLFTYEELEEATSCFDENRELGDGGFGTVYKGRSRSDLLSPAPAMCLVVAIQTT